ncbi:MAG: hypothetical protein ACE5D4_03010 [Thermodesulfobacteriota bacterium]
MARAALILRDGDATTTAQSITFIYGNLRKVASLGVKRRLIALSARINIPTMAPAR